MRIDTVVMYFGLERAEDICGFALKRRDCDTLLRQQAQMRVHIASKGEIPCDEHLLGQIMQIARIESNKIMVHGCDGDANASIDCANIGI